ncbi:hypothetical protein MUCCIDRAFT_113236 [Mucor lusitanicus CBS 277.49]|uniref:Uncharacterized protein n=1 Tax=Mucor lusitanicus CBS 277.49 TaxID=747725 RepID=A0A168IC65_MUCCL|nr:hypothetical protein MUCCIDRAFT_113236 [Mucor lusitanicus CBS 277.49]
MKAALLLATLFCIQCVWANTEKLILQVDSAKLTSCDPHFEALSKAREAASLKPPFSEVQSSIIPQRDVQWYTLDNVKDNANYEIKISYPAIATDFYLKIVNQCKRPDGSLSFTLQVAAKYTGVSQIKDMDVQPVVYNLVLENLYLGFLFYQVYKIVVAIIVVLAIGFFLWMPYVKSLIVERPKSE